MAKTAQIFSVRTSDANGFRWAWRSSPPKRESSSSFVYFYECVQDARAAGYAVELSGDHATTVDGRPVRGLT